MKSVFALVFALLLMAAGSLSAQASSSETPKEPADYEVDAEFPGGGQNYEIGEDYPTMNLRISEGHFQALFFNDENKIVKPPVDLVVIRWEKIANLKDEGHLPLKAYGNAAHLEAPRPVFPPYAFRLFVVIPDPASDEPVFASGAVLFHG